MAALVEASASSPQGSSPQGTILWSELVREFNAAYDVVFDNMGRKAYFDFNRVNPPPPPGSNYIDGAKKRWKLPFLMDAISCAFYHIQPNTQRRKARKFNQHDVLAKVLRSLVGRSRQTFAGPLILVVDMPAWTTFGNLRREFEFRGPKKSVTKYHNISSMYLSDEGMIAQGLPNVLSAVAESLANVTSLLLTASTDDYTAATDLLNRTSRSNYSISSGSVEASHGMEFDNTAHTMDSIETTESMFMAIPDNSGHRTLLDHQDEDFTRDTERSSNWTADPSLLVVVLAANGTALQQLYGDGTFITFAARASEAVEIKLVCTSDPLEWIFKAKDAAGAQTLIDLGRFRVFGNDLLTAPYTPYI